MLLSPCAKPRLLLDELALAEGKSTDVLDTLLSNLDVQAAKQEGHYSPIVTYDKGGTKIAHTNNVPPSVINSKVVSRVPPLPLGQPNCLCGRVSPIRGNAILPPISTRIIQPTIITERQISPHWNVLYRAPNFISPAAPPASTTVVNPQTIKYASTSRLANNPMYMINNNARTTRIVHGQTYVRLTSPLFF